MSFLVVNADNFIIGSVAGAAVLGFYAVAFSWGAKVPGLIAGAIGPTLLSTFSRVQQETERLKRGYLTILEYVSFAAILANVLLLVLSRELLTLVLGGGTGKWLPALAALKILCVYGALRAILRAGRQHDHRHRQAGAHVQEYCYRCGLGDCLSISSPQIFRD